MRLKTKMVLDAMITCVYVFLLFDIGSANRPTNEHAYQQPACVFPYNLDLRSPAVACFPPRCASPLRASPPAGWPRLFVLAAQTARATKAAVGTPAYVYDAASLKANAEACLAFPNAYGLTVRYAMKSLPNKAVLQLFQG